MQDDHTDLRELRKGFDVSQAKFSGYMGVPLRTYQDIEAGISPLKEIHIRAAEMAALQLAVDRLKFDRLPLKLQQMLVNFKAEIPDRMPR